MKKPSENGKKITAAKVIAGVAATAAICLNLNGCVYGPEVPPSDNQNPDVYGPPESMVQVDETDPSDDVEETRITVDESEFSVDDNQNPDVYGPPEDFERGADETGETEETEESAEVEESETSESEG